MLQRSKQRDLARHTIIQESGMQMRRDKVYLVSPDTDEVSIYYLLFVEFGMGRVAWVIGNQAHRSGHLLCFGDLRQAGLTWQEPHELESSPGRHDARKEVGPPTETWEVIMKPFLYVLYQDLMSDHGINKFKCDVIVCKQ